MITYEEAYKLVLEQGLDLGIEKVALQDSLGRILAENIHADRDFPAFHRATKDGIAINFKAIEEKINELKIEGIASAGIPQQKLSSYNNCLEIMTGAVLPKNTDTVIMYEHIDIEGKQVQLSRKPVKGQNIHLKGSDTCKGEVILNKGKKLSAAEIGILASVGKIAVQVKKLPAISVFSTGNELVPVSETPLPHQIRRSNSWSIAAALQELHIQAEKHHLPDEKPAMKSSLKTALSVNDVLILSGGVSKGKYDYVSEVMEDLGVKKIFHKVYQRPGKPFWFGFHPIEKTVVFSFPGNPVSTFANYHIYFKDWLAHNLGLDLANHQAVLAIHLKIEEPFTRFINVSISWDGASLRALPVKENGSGDLVSLAKTDGFIKLVPGDYPANTEVPFIATRKII